jgi:prophage regulatory protein
MQKILRLPAVKDRTGWSRSSIYKGMGDGTFPRCVALGARAIGWFEADVDEWIASRVAKGHALAPVVPPAQESGKSRIRASA